MQTRDIFRAEPGPLGQQRATTFVPTKLSGSKNLSEILPSPLSLSKHRKRCVKTWGGGAYFDKLWEKTEGGGVRQAEKNWLQSGFVLKTEKMDPHHCWGPMLKMRSFPKSSPPRGDFDCF